MNNLLQLNKRGVSLMIGYVILIAIAIALSTAVFFFLKLYLPSEKPQCYENIDLVIDESNCSIINFDPISGLGAAANIYIAFSNRGLFSLDAAYIKFGEVDRTFRTILHDPERDLLSSNCNGQSPNLRPGAQFCKPFTYSSTVSSSKVYEVSVEPLIWIDNKPVLCPESIVKKRIGCSP